MKGFQLMELLITLAIISILTTAVLPTYRAYFTRAHRLEAELTLSQLAIAMEKYQLHHHTYTNATLTSLHFSEFISKQSYQLRIVSAKLSTYELRAVPIHEQSVNDQACGELILTSDNQKLVSGNSKPDDCW